MKAKYKSGDRLFFVTTFTRQVVAATVLGRERRLFMPWAWRYLVKYTVHDVGFGFRTQRVKWMGEWRLHEY